MRERCEVVRAAETCPYSKCRPPELMPSPSLIPARAPRFLFGLAVLLALGHAALAVLAMRDKSTTSDELAHVTGGYTFNQLGDYRLQPENGILPQRLQALPAAIMGVHYPAPDGRAWRESDVWETGHKFFYELGNDPEWMLFTARAMNTLFGAATVLLVFCWTRRLFGETGAMVAALFCALSPTMLAHSALATSDMAMAFFFLASCGAYWRHLQTGRERDWALSALVFGLACVAKYSAVLLLPMMALMALARVMQPESFYFAGRSFDRPLTRLGGIALSTLGHGLVAVAMIWLFFGFRFSACNPLLPAGQFSMPWEYVLAIGDAGADVINFFRHWHLLPEGYLYGLAFVVKHAEARGAFLDGDYSLFGWAAFFPKAFFYKTTEALLLATAAAGVFALLRARAEGWRRWAAGLLPFTPLLALFGVYWIFSLTSHLNIGHRHILPTYPALFIFTGVLGAAVVRAADKSRSAAWTLGTLVIVLVGGQAVTTAHAFPNYLAYFNQLSGGPENGYRHLVDSSLDWGQELPGLARWLEKNSPPGGRAYLSYFGTGEPDYYGIRATRLPFINAFRRPPEWYQPAGGIYCIGATMLQQVYSPVRGDWTLAREKEYQDLRRLAPVLQLYFTVPASRAELLKSTTVEQVERAWKRLDLLRFARLCAYLRTRKPDAMIGYSILIYRLTDEEVDAAVNRSFSAWVDAVEKTRAR